MLRRMGPCPDRSCVTETEETASGWQRSAGIQAPGASGRRDKTDWEGTGRTAGGDTGRTFGRGTKKAAGEGAVRATGEDVERAAGEGVGRVAAGDAGGAVIRIADAPWPRIFPWRLEYNCPVHENWNIVHTGMLIPEAHQIYVCSDNCLRGVVMTSYEMGCAERISSVMPTEREVTGGRLEEITIEGVTNVIRRLPVRPRAVELFLVCMHHLTGADEHYIYEALEKRFPDIDFIRCWMDPVMQKISDTPEQKQRRSMMEVIPKQPAGADSPFVSVLGDNLRLPDSSDISRLLRRIGIRILQVQDCTDYDSYRKLGAGCFFLTRSAPAVCGLEAFSHKQGRGFVYLPPAAGDAEIREELLRLLDGIPVACRRGEYGAEDLERFLAWEQEETKMSFSRTWKMVQDAEIWVDSLACPRPLGTARRLLQEGFRVTRICTDAVSPEEETDFRRLQENAPDLQIQSVSHVRARAGRETRPGGRILAIGPKAAFYADTPYFVNWIEYDGNWGYDGLRKLSDAMADAWENPKDPRDLVQRKGLGLPSLIGTDSCIVE